MHIMTQTDILHRPDLLAASMELYLMGLLPESKLDRICCMFLMDEACRTAQSQPHRGKISREEIARRIAESAQLPMGERRIWEIDKATRQLIASSLINVRLIRLHKIFYSRSIDALSLPPFSGPSFF